MHKGLAAAAVITGSLLIPSTAPALLEGAGDGAVDTHGGVNPAADGYERLFIGDRYAYVFVFAFAGAASSLPTEADPLPERSLCGPSSAIDTTTPWTADAAPGLSAAREGICFDLHDAIEYYGSPRDAESRLVGPDDVDVPWAVRSQFVDSQLFTDRSPASRESPAKPSRATNVSAPAKASRPAGARDICFASGRLLALRRTNRPFIAWASKVVRFRIPVGFSQKGAFRPAGAPAERSRATERDCPSDGLGRSMELAERFAAPFEAGQQLKAANAVRVAEDPYRKPAPLSFRPVKPRSANRRVRSLLA